MSNDPTVSAPPGLTSPALTFGRGLAMLSATAAVIHFDVANSHYQEYWAFGAFLLAAAVFQIAWAGIAFVTARQWLFAVGAVVNAWIVGVYIVTRTVGDVIGPDPHDVEPVGFGDAFCTAVEALVVVGCLAMLFGWAQRFARRPQSSRQAGWQLGTTGVVMLGLLSLALLDGGPEMSMTMAGGSSVAVVASSAGGSGGGMSMPMGGSSEQASVHLPTSSPAGAIRMPQPMAQMAKGMQMVSPPCTAAPTQAQQQAAVRLVNRSWADAKPYRNLAAAKAAGYVPITPTGLPVVHYINLRYYEHNLSAQRPLTPRHPASLVYANTPHGAVLVATMFITSNGSPPPQPGGCLTQWHRHTNLCFGQFATVVGVTHDGRCAEGSVNRVTPPMLHVWYVPIPGGPTAVDATDAQVVRAAEKVKSPANPMA